MTASQFTVYIDRQLAPLTTATIGSASAPVSGSGTILIGRHQAWNQWFSGSIDEVAIYDRALSAARVAAHYQPGA